MKRNVPRAVAAAAAIGLASCIIVTSISLDPEILSGDYLSPALRDQVARLKIEVAGEPTSAETVDERAKTLWDWANAYALTGRSLPVNLTATISSLGYTEGEPSRPRAQLASIDDYIHELSIKDETPEAMGTLTLDPPEGPFAALSFQSFEMTYTVGSMPMAEGGLVLLGHLLMSDHGSLQLDDPAADNHVTIRSSNPAARFVPTTHPLQGMHGGFRAPAPMPSFRLEGTSLAPGETFTITFGDRSGGGRGLRMQSFVNDRFTIPLYLDLEANGILLTPDWPAYEIVGGPATAIMGFVPSVLAPGEPFDLSIRAEDRFYNRASGSMPAYEVTLNGRPWRSIPEGGPALNLIEDVTIEEPGVYRFGFLSTGGALTGSSNPILVSSQRRDRIYWGETHAHSSYAEGMGSVDFFFRYARDDARLDFVTLSEHDIWLDDYEWKTLQDAVRKYRREGEFIPVLGYEWSIRRQWGGHHNVLFRSEDSARVPAQFFNTLGELYQGLNNRFDPENVLVIPHAHQAADWRLSDPATERLVEIYSMHGSFEWFGNRYLQNGYEVGFIGASDDHRSLPGYSGTRARGPLAQFGGLAAVIAEEKTTDAIFSAMRERAAYATSGQRIILDARLNGEPMGTRIEYSDTRRLACRVLGTAPIESVDLIKNGRVILARHYLEAPLTPQVWVRLEFESSSETFIRDNPRGYRPWSGWIEVQGARAVEVRTPGFENRHVERAAIDPARPGRIDFYTETRGRADVMLIRLEGASTATRLTVHLEPAREYAVAPVRIRPFADLPAEDLEFSFADLESRSVEHELHVGRHRDRVTAALVDPEGALDREFEFVDRDSPARGDYYYVRVKQLDGGRAWSSPWWVGGEGPR